MNGRTPDARRIAVNVLDAVCHRRLALGEALSGHGDLTQLSPRDRAFARLLVTTVLRRRGQIDAVLDHCLSKPLPARARTAHAALRLGAAQLLFLDTPAHAAISTAVDLVTSRGADRFKGVVNAVLRRISHDGPGWVAAQDAARLNTPAWLWQTWSAAYGDDHARAIATQHMREPPMDLTPRAPAEAAALFPDAVRLPTGSLRLVDAGQVENLPGFAAGAWWVQDTAAAIPARLLHIPAGETVLDLCAAPGGKTAQLAAAGGHVVAVDRSPSRGARLRQNLDRLGLDAKIVIGDIADWRPTRPAKFVLLDAPCTATGTIRRHPDIAYNKSAGDVAQLADTQRVLLRSAAAMVAPGGTLVYTTCSLQPEEGPMQIDALCATEPRLARDPIRLGEIDGLKGLIAADGCLRTLPCHWAEMGGMDGFYAARLKRIS